MNDGSYVHERSSKTPPNLVNLVTPREQLESTPAATAMSADAEESDLNTPYFFPDERPVRFTLEVFPHSGKREEREPAVFARMEIGEPARALCRNTPGSTNMARCSSNTRLSSVCFDGVAQLEFRKACSWPTNL